MTPRSAMAPMAANPFCAYEPAAPDQASPAIESPAHHFHPVILPRHGLRPLHICGRSLLHVSNRCVGLPAWSELTLFETLAGGLASTLTHHLTEGLGGIWRDSALHASALALPPAIRAHDPMIALVLPCTDLVVPGHRCRQSGEDAALAGLFRSAWFGMVRAVFGDGPR
jgi:hypothetical protein